MGVSYFSCDECGHVMNDAGGGMQSVHLEYKENGVLKDGNYCEDCASEIRVGRVPCVINLNIVFCLKKPNRRQICDIYGCG